MAADPPAQQPAAAVMINKLRPTPKKEDDLNLYDMYPPDDQEDAKAELHRVSYSDIADFHLQDGGVG